MRTIYLAGKMENVSLDEQSDWREYVTPHLTMNGWRVLNPVQRSLKDGYNHRRIYELDMRDVRESDVVLANLVRSQSEGHGTAMEVHFAYQNNIPVMGYATLGQKKHPFLEVCVTEWVTDLDKATKILNEFYT